VSVLFSPRKIEPTPVFHAGHRPISAAVHMETTPVPFPRPLSCGLIYFSSNYNNKQTIPQSLGGGNIQIRTAQFLDGPTGPGAPAGTVVTAAQVQSLVPAAIARWQQAGISPDQVQSAGGTGEYFWVPLVVPDQCLHSFDDHAKASRRSPKSGRESSEGLRVESPLVDLVRSDGRWTIGRWHW
jgi:hypothetical protein